MRSIPWVSFKFVFIFRFPLLYSFQLQFYNLTFNFICKVKLNMLFKYPVTQNNLKSMWFDNPYYSTIDSYYCEVVKLINLKSTYHVVETRTTLPWGLFISSQQLWQTVPVSRSGIAKQQAIICKKNKWFSLGPLGEVGTPASHPVDSALWRRELMAYAHRIN